jgi:hypothetical protein
MVERMDANPTLVLSKELASGERLLWSGRPQQGVVVRRTDLFLIPFSLLWCGFAVFWEATVLTSKAPLLFRLWGIPFVLVGLYLVVGRFLVDAHQRGQTVYGLTDQNVVIVSGLRTRNVKRLTLRTLSDVSLDESTDRRGTITFGPTPPASAWFGGRSWPGMGRTMVPSFDLIENARVVYDLILRTQRAA